MSIIKKAPAIRTREVHLEEPVNQLLEDYARFIESSPDHVINSALKKVLWRDQDYRKWREARHRTARLRQRTAGRSAGEGLMQRTLESRAFIAAVLAMAAGTFLVYAHPFHDEQIFLHVIAVRAPHAFLSFKYLYYTFLFTTPYIVCLTLLSALYIFTLRARQHISPGRLPKYPDPRARDDLFLVVGEVHNPRKPVPAKAPSWLTIPERGLFTGI